MRWSLVTSTVYRDPKKTHDAREKAPRANVFLKLHFGPVGLCPDPESEVKFDCPRAVPEPLAPRLLTSSQSYWCFRVLTSSSAPSRG